MHCSRVPTLLVCLAAHLAQAATANAGIEASGPLALDGNPIRPRRQVPDDPLAGLPTEEDGRPSKGKGGRSKTAACNLDAKAANARDIGDLRATLAFVQRGPRIWPCPPRSAGNGAGLRLSIDEAGKITAAEAVGPATGVAAAIAKKLTGKSIAPRAAGPTSGTVLLTFTPAKGR
ncbi:MAG: hypothetical protein JXP73_10550 [Deltaproteobacteria bacterium]|nr:hypothetical protein [Deltaproteobacteria bacterium]